MKLIYFVCAALAAASAAYARAPKKSAPPAEPSETVKVNDVRLGEKLDSVCVPKPMSYEPYDGRDNLLIIEAKDHSSALLQLSGGCNFNMLMFAESIAPKTSDGCMTVGDDIVVADSFGAAHECKVAHINQWSPDKTYLKDYDES